ncbi:hypothetical protein [Nocardioides zhouii]|uniref:DUF4878 domain-containing protein n=1 Tax=Nocardioides zhouii TaxID=1168729 RepID=A0A4Q2SHJ9_9ACTN|nr:hypothetical protein [Nocardioides zhouii]RYC03328.1 hypothetical protein EUA94_21920 [Nocardioides zhouii]
MAQSAECATSSALIKKPALAVKRFMAAVEAGDGVTACSLLTKRAEAEAKADFVEIGLVDADASCPEMIQDLSEAVAEMGGYGTIRARTIVVNGNKAKVKLTTSAFNTTEIHRLRRVSGTWLLDGNS